jgi:hypothetical protein
MFFMFRRLVFYDQKVKFVKKPEIV